MHFDELPVFPLPGAVLMPGEVLPLHIFEPRYRAMLAHVLASEERLLGVATLLGGDDFHQVVGVGRVIASEELPDGRSNIALVHAYTVQVVRELQVEHPFRCVEAECVVNALPDEQGFEAVRTLVLQLLLAQGSDPSVIEELEGMDLVHATARQVYRHPLARLEYLAKSDAARVDLLVEALSRLLAGRLPPAEA